MSESFIHSEAQQRMANGLWCASRTVSVEKISFPKIRLLDWIMIQAHADTKTEGPVPENTIIRT